MFFFFNSEAETDFHIFPIWTAIKTLVNAKITTVTNPNRDYRTLCRSLSKWGKKCISSIISKCKMQVLAHYIIDLIWKILFLHISLQFDLLNCDSFHTFSITLLLLQMSFKWNDIILLQLQIWLILYCTAMSGVMRCRRKFGVFLQPMFYWR